MLGRLGGSDDAQAIPAALAYDMGGNLWMCQVVNGWIAHRYRPLDREAFDDEGYRVAETAEPVENPLEMTEVNIMAGESEECAPKRPRSLSWSGDSRGELMMARHALDQNNLALMTNGHSIVTVDLARGRSLLSLDLPRDDLKRAFDADAAPEPTCGPRTLGSKLLLRNIIVHAFFLGLVFNAAVPCRGAFADASLALGSAFAPVMFVLIGLSAPSPGALAREVRDVSAVVATRSLVQVALVLLNLGHGPGRRAADGAPRVRAQRAVALHEHRLLLRRGVPLRHQAHRRDARDAQRDGLFAHHGLRPRRHVGEYRRHRRPPTAAAPTVAKC